MTVFFNAIQMAIPHTTVLELQNEGFFTVANLGNFDKDTLQQIINNLFRPDGRIPDPTQVSLQMKRY